MLRHHYCFDCIIECRNPFSYVLVLREPSLGSANNQSPTPLNVWTCTGSGHAERFRTHPGHSERSPTWAGPVQCFIHHHGKILDLEGIQIQQRARGQGLFLFFPLWHSPIFAYTCLRSYTISDPSLILGWCLEWFWICSSVLFVSFRLIISNWFFFSTWLVTSCQELRGIAYKTIII